MHVNIDFRPAYQWHYCVTVSCYYSISVNKHKISRSVQVHVDVPFITEYDIFFVCFAVCDIHVFWDIFNG